MAITDKTDLTTRATALRNSTASGSVTPAIEGQLIIDLLDTYEARFLALEGSVQPYFGLVANRCFSTNKDNADITKGMCVTNHTLQNSVTSLKVAFENQGYGGTWEASVKDTGGVWRRFKFSGSNTGTVPAQGLLLSDELLINLPAGEIQIAQYIESARIKYNDNVKFGNDYGAFSSVNAQYGTPTNQVDNADAVTNGTFFTRAPLAILGLTTKPSFLLAGDSRIYGSYGDQNQTNGHNGEVAISLGNNAAYINNGIPGGEIPGYDANDFIWYLQQFVSHVVLEYTINELQHGISAQDMKARINYFISQSTKPVIVTTTSPHTDSTDGWATAINQTPKAWEAARIEINNWKRTLPTGIIACWDVADAVETARNSGLWKPNYTVDGLHDNVTGYQAIGASGKVEYQLITI